jgi:hypothetical protein
MGWLASMLTLDHVLLEAKSVPRPWQSVALLRSERLPVSARVVLSPLGPPGRSHEHRGPTYPLRVSAQYAPTSACTALSVPRPSPMKKRPPNSSWGRQDRNVLVCARGLYDPP